MEFAPAPSSRDISPTPEVFRMPLQEVLSAQKIEEKLQEGKKIWDLMKHVEELVYRHKNKIAEIHDMKLALAELSDIGSRTNDVVHGHDQITVLQNEERTILSEIIRTEMEINEAFSIEQKDDDEHIKLLIKEWKDKHASAEDLSCSFMGYQSGYGQTPSCSRIVSTLQEIQYQILAKRVENYWLNHSLAEFKSSETLLSPGDFQTNGSFINVKAILDGARKVAITERDISEGTERLLTSPRPKLSKLFLTYPPCIIIYKEGEYERARDIAALLETRGNKSNNPQTVFNYHASLGNLLEEDKAATYRSAIEKARVIDPDFSPSN